MRTIDADAFKKCIDAQEGATSDMISRQEAIEEGSGT